MVSDLVAFFIVAAYLLHHLRARRADTPVA
jgi:hypothetical protein